MKNLESGLNRSPQRFSVAFTKQRNWRSFIHSVQCAFTREKKAPWKALKKKRRPRPRSRGYKNNVRTSDEPDQLGKCVAVIFTPLNIGPLTLRNRTVRASAFEGMCNGHNPSAELIEYHRSVAAGGIGMTTVAYAAVEQSGLSFPHQLWIRPEIVADLRKLTECVHKEGAAAAIQIGHCGNMAKSAVAGGRPIAPSARPNLYALTWPRAMTGDDIKRVATSFGNAVHLAREAGFNAVEVHAGHGYLISQFLSPYTNRRKDKYGGSIDGRMRFMCEVIEQVRAAAESDIAVVVKMNLSDGFAGGQTLDEGVLIARQLEQLGVDALVLSGGFVSRSPMYILRGAMPTDVMAELMTEKVLKMGARLFGKMLVPKVPYEKTYFLRDAKVIQREVKLPLIYVGGVTSREDCEAVLKEGFQAIAMARALIIDPDFIKKLAQEGASAPCDHCNYCAARIYTTHMACHFREPPLENVRYRLQKHLESL
ncbi:MAG: NADH:flavin oxidoreductase [Polyangiaceae bacterium]|nr:NADH:flavin oxidoreductase [Polyangiaceae bacterium]